MDNEVKIFVGSSGRSANHAKKLIEIIEEDAKKHAKTISCTHWHDAFPLSETTYNNLLQMAAELKECKGYAVFLFAPDDYIITNKGAKGNVDKEEYATRDNVVFELGLFLGCLGKEYVFCVLPTNLKNFHKPSDINGVTIAPYDHKWGRGIKKQMEKPAEAIIRQIYLNEGVRL